jgi:thymidine kinase
MNSRLDIIIGPMFSGKSFELIRRIRLLKILEKKYLVIKPKIDNRYTKDNVICTHNYDREECIQVKNLYDSIQPNSNFDYDTIFIDEAQFFTDLKEFVLDVLENKKINVVLAGLDGDFMRKPFGQVLELIPFSDTCVKKNALCKMCKDGTYALFSHRLSKNNGEQVLVGSTEIYTPVCRKHYVELNSF